MTIFRLGHASNNCMLDGAMSRFERLASEREARSPETIIPGPHTKGLIKLELTIVRLSHDESDGATAQEFQDCAKACRCAVTDVVWCAETGASLTTAGRPAPPAGT
jgi:neutral trehalase